MVLVCGESWMIRQICQAFSLYTRPCVIFNHHLTSYWLEAGLTPITATLSLNLANLYHSLKEFQQHIADTWQYYFYWQWNQKTLIGFGWVKYCQMAFILPNSPKFSPTRCLCYTVSVKLIKYVCICLYITQPLLRLLITLVWISLQLNNL